MADETFNDPEIRELYERAKAGDEEARRQLEAMFPGLVPINSPYDRPRFSPREEEVMKALDLLERLANEKKGPQ